MKSSSYLLLTVTSMCYAVQDDILRLLDGEDVSLDLESFWPSDHSIRSPEDAYSSKSHSAAFLNEINNELRQWKHGLATAEWNYKTNITDHNKDEFTNVATRYEIWRLRQMKEARRFNIDVLPEDLSSKFPCSNCLRSPVMPERRSQLQQIMEGSYGTGQACLTNGTCLALEPEVTHIMSNSRDPELLKEVWLQWRNGVGPSMKKHYVEFISLLNIGAVENGFSDYSQFWKQDLFYNTPELDRMLQKLWTSVRPLYLQLHAYVRRKLTEYYGRNIVGDDGSIPAHLLGNMWAQHWSNIIDIVIPFPEVSREDQIEARLKTHVDVRGMFNMAERFYKSIGFHRMTPTFWKKSMLEKPKGDNVLCQASSFDMFYPGDYRIKMCSDVTYANFKTVHHEMGHIEYFMTYADQPTIFREGANAAFQEAVGDTIGLSVMSATHLKALGFVESDENCLSRESLRILRQKATINSLLHMALEKIAFLPFGILVDTWRWGVMQGAITPENYNRKWWELRLQFQGIRAPVPRSENDFDPGAKYHIPANSNYISYFVSYIQQFQMYKSMCQLSSFRGPLHECDFYGSKTAGNKLRHVMSDGSSVPWQDQLEYLTGSGQVTADAILEYFQPLYEWLILDNSLHKETVGWEGASINWHAQ
ncbi:unnamed protein product [Candidula unifasciata]|uniref:Angiotensin-converting enzyme n=1 Tax=Candidula unifasciata TaxID=100452 RepID=A0A8S3YX64_9EUPU|nr:unnamed protein product [Candidula unifasciata]